MIFRYLLRRRMQRLDKRLFLPAVYKKQVESGAYDRYWKMSEWRAFRMLYFPMSIIREADPRDLRKLQGMIEQTLTEAKEKEKHDSKASA